MGSSHSAARSEILVVDDERDIRELLGVLLERGGHDVRRAADGRAGLRRVSRPPARPRDPRRHDARARRLADARAHPRPLRRPGPHADGAQRRARARARAARRQRRLRRQAVRPPGAARARRRAAAPHARRRADARRTTPTTRSRSTSRATRSGRDGHEVALTPLEFRLLSAFVRHPHQVLTPRPADQARLGRPGERLARPGEALRRLPATQARRGARRVHRDGPRLRLPLPAPGLSPAHAASGAGYAVGRLSRARRRPAARCGSSCPRRPSS